MSSRYFGVCCEKCQLYGTCEAKWYRGEKGEENVCCRSCNHYDDCLIEKVKKVARLKKELGFDPFKR